GILQLLAQRRRVELFVGVAGGGGQGLHAEAVPPPGDGGQGILGLLVAADAPAALHGAGGIAGEGTDEVENILAAADEEDETLPAQAQHFGQQLPLLVRALDVAKVNAAVALDARQDREEVGMQWVWPESGRGSGRKHEGILRKGRPRGGGLA